MAGHKEHLKKIVEILTESIPAKFGLMSIILYGGFARGEGRMIDGINGKIPYGDYDLLIITRSSLPEKLIQRLLYDKIYKEVMRGTSVDITNETLSGPKSMNCDLSSYDLLKTGRTVWGGNLLDTIEIDIEDIPIVSFLRIINNRINVILMEYNKKDSLKKSVIKLYLDIGGYLAFTHKVYTPFFEERVRNLKGLKIDSVFPGLIERIETATEEKLNPATAKDIKKTDIIDVLSCGLKIMEEIISRTLNKKHGSITVDETADLVYKKLPAKYYLDFINNSLRGRICRPFLKAVLPLLSLSANLYENCYFRMHAITRDRFSFRGEWRSPIVINMAVTMLLAGFIVREKRDYLTQVGRYLGKISPGAMCDDFEKLRDVNTDLWSGYTRRARKRNLYKALRDLLVR